MFERIINVIDAEKLEMPQSEKYNLFKSLDRAFPFGGNHIIRDLDKWHNISTIEYEFEVLELKNWITNRLEWLDTNMPGDCEINISEYINSKSVIKTIDLLGRDANQKGFNIEIYDDGSVEKKYVIE